MAMTCRTLVLILCASVGPTAGFARQEQHPQDLRLDDRFSTMQTHTSKDAAEEFRAVELPTSVGCSMTATMHSYNVSASFEEKRGWVTAVYTLTPFAAMETSDNLDQLAFSFTDCTCKNPDRVTGLMVHEYTVGYPDDVGKRIDFTKSCEGTTELTLDEIGDESASHTFQVKFTIMDRSFAISKIGMSIVAGGRSASERICGPVCEPDSVTTTRMDAPATTTLRASFNPFEQAGAGGSQPVAQPHFQPASQPNFNPSIAQGHSAAAPAPIVQSATTVLPASAVTTTRPAIQDAAPVAGTAAPLPQDAATTFGDPHVANTKGEKFDILTPGNYTFLSIPRRVGEQPAMLQVLANVELAGDTCAGVLYITGLIFSGQWLGDVRRLEFLALRGGSAAAHTAIKMRMGSSLAFLTLAEFEAAVPAALGKVTVLQPAAPHSTYEHVTTLLVELKLGPCTSKVRLVYQKEKAGFSNSLWLSTSGLRHVQEEIGGILGVDTHELAESLPKECRDPSTGSIMRPVLPHGGAVHASAELDDDSVP